jgi:molybdenum cofactor guanylyltransferase
MMHHSGYDGVTLAGGRALRMGGGDKALLPLTDKPMLHHVIIRLAPQVRALAINANGSADRFAAFGLPILPDSIPGFPGPLAGILAAMDWCAARGGHTVITVAGDTPFFPSDLVARLDSARRPSAPCLATTPRPDGGLDWHPTFGLWPVELRQSLRQAIDDGARKVLSWAQHHGATSALFAQEPNPFFNVNTREDLIIARQRAKQT